MHGKKAYDAGKYSSAVKAWSGAETGALLDPIRGLLMARAYEAMGRHDRAERSLRLFLERHPKSPYKKLAEDALLKNVYAQNKSEAIEVLGRRIASSDNGDKPSLILMAADLHKKMGNSKEAAELYGKLFVRYPATVEGLEAAEKLAWLVFYGKAPKPDFSASKLEERAGRLYSRGRFGLAALGYRHLLEADPSDKNLKFKLARSLYKARRNDEAIRMLRDLLKEDLSEKLLGKALYTLSLLYWRVDDDEGFRDVCNRLLKEGPESLKTRAAFNLGIHAFERGRYTVADEYFAEVLKRNPGNGTRTTLYWKRAWMDYHRKRFSSAAEDFRRTEKLAGSADTRLGARYWRARSLANAGKKDEARELFEKLARDHPLNYYGMQAEAMLKALHGSRPSNGSDGRGFPDITISDRHRKHAEVAIAEELMDCGLDEFALIHLEDLPRSVRSDPAIAFLRARAAQGAGRFRRGHDILYAHFGRYIADPPQDSPREFIEAAYPRIHFKRVLQLADRHAVDPNLVWAVIRQESRYDREAVSPAGALGLMQVTPGATGMAPQKGPVPAEIIARILDPEKNLEFGIKILGGNLQQFEGNVIPAVASYNADIAKVRQWVEKNRHLAPDEFIDNIPYYETRTYVKKVLAGYRAYEYLHRRSNLAARW